MADSSNGARRFEIHRSLALNVLYTTTGHLKVDCSAIRLPVS
jgi:hypothetical protein